VNSEPQYVQAYTDAQFWLFLHYGLPALIVIGLIYAIAAWYQYLDDIHVNDEDEDEWAKKVGKTLGL
jgi:hypothetical protein